LEFELGPFKIGQKDTHTIVSRVERTSIIKISLTQMLLNSPKEDFIPVHFGMRSKTSCAIALCCAVADFVLLITLIGHKRKYPPTPLHFDVVDELSDMLPS